MKSTIIKNLLATTLLTGAVVTAAATFNGGVTLDLAKAKINELTTTITQFGTNEKAMKDKITSLKLEVETLQTKITTGEGDKTTLENKIKELNTQIETLTTQLDEANAETVKANAEIALANEKASALQTELDSFNQVAGTIAPMTQEELNTLVGTTIPAPSEPTKTGTTLSLSNIGSKYQDEKIIIEVKANNTLYLTSLDVNGTDSPYWFTTNGENKQSLFYGANKEITFKSGDVLKVEGNNGSTIVEITLQ